MDPLGAHDGPQAMPGMKRICGIIGVLVLLGIAFCASPATAQPSSVCDACVASGGCESAGQACIAQCRAQFFTVDPHRSQCISQCAATANQCTRAKQVACRSENACR